MSKKVISKPLKLQVLDIGDDDVDFKYVITLYCKDENNNNIVCHVNKFKPSFYIRVPYKSIDELKRIIIKVFQYNLENDLLKKFNGDENDDEYKISFDNKLKFYTDSTCPFYCGMTYSSVKEQIIL